MIDADAIFPTSVIGCHGCTQTVAEAILAQGRFLPSENRYDWLGRGVYFWEYAPYRALEWARLACLESGGRPAVLAATLQLRNCINLLDVDRHEELSGTNAYLVKNLGENGLPKNTARGGNFRDRIVIDSHCERLRRSGSVIDTVRGTFPEGEPIYPDSRILSLAHTQIAVRSPDCITDIQLVRF